ncbi:related to 54S ribosomal protein L13,mitochondrial [Zygosaccharomyces bailii ISA1307]|nr:related to 54S ribosomal protein L13,mitochondrial [Zygosaccharomyces bailii ISA1307]
MWRTQSARRIHITARRGDFFSWFKTKKEEVKDTKDIIKDIEAGKKVATDKGSRIKLDLIPSNFIGEESLEVRKKSQERRVNSVTFNKWLSRSKVATEQELDSIIDESMQATTNSSHSSVSTPFVDLVTKFKFTKALQTKTGYMVPDYTITVATTPLQFKDYFMQEILSGKLRRFKESEPNAIDLSNKDYGSPNVHIVSDINFKKQKRKFGKIIKKVHALEHDNLKRIVEEAKRQ